MPSGKGTVKMPGHEHWKFGRVISTLFISMPIVFYVLFCQVPHAAAALSVYVSIEPEAYFVERIGGDRVSVSVLVGPGQSPHTFDPTPGVMARLGRCDIFFRIGMAFEARLLEKIGSSSVTFRVVDLRKGIVMRYMSGSTERGTRREPDPHIWMSPRRVLIMAERIRDVLTEADPGHASLFRNNWGRFRDDLVRLNDDFMRIFKPYKGARVLVFHPAYGYFLEDYGLVQVAVEAEGKSPGARHLSQLIAQARRDGVRAVFVQPQFSKRTAAVIADAVGGDVIEFDPLARDYIVNLRSAAEKLASVLSMRVKCSVAGGAS